MVQVSDETKCQSCGKYLDTAVFSEDEWYDLFWEPNGVRWVLCSPSCLVEFAWKLKEAQPKR